MATTRASAPFGRLNADPDSPDYALACKVRAQGCLNSHKSDIELLEGWVSELRTNNRYRHLDDDHGHPFRDWHHFCTTKQPFGLGYSPEAISEIIHERRKAQELAADPGVTAVKAHGANQHAESETGLDIIKSSEQESGTSAAYIVRRLKRDAPEVAEALAKGEFKSARAAGIAAGIVRVKPAPERAMGIVRRMSTEELYAFEDQFNQFMQGRPRPL